MAMDAGEIERLIKAKFPDAQVEIRDLAGDGDHYAAHVVSAAFKGKTPRAAAPDGLRGARRPHGRGAARAGADHGCAMSLPTVDIASGRGTHLPTDRPRSRRGRRAANRTKHPEGPHMTPQQDVQDWIRKTIAQNDVVLFMKGTKAMPAVRVLRPGRPDPRPPRRRLQGRQRARGHGHPRGHQGLLQLADDPAALRQGRVRRRLRHRARDVRRRASCSS